MELSLTGCEVVGWGVGVICGAGVIVAATGGGWGWLPASSSCGWLVVGRREIGATVARGAGGKVNFRGRPGPGLRLASSYSGRPWVTARMISSLLWRDRCWVRLAWLVPHTRHMADTLAPDPLPPSSPVIVPRAPRPG